MCGIAGIVNLKRKPIDELKNKVNLMNEAQKHRGPDADGIWLNKNQNAGLGHRRLAIVDLSPKGKQPMSNEDGSVQIVFNGEIYNHKEIRKELIKKGHKYFSKSDTESMIHAYEEWGEKCLDRFRGMFSFAIWDENKQKLFFARDRIGIKPFYYTIKNNNFYFASEIKAILVNGEIERKMDDESFYHYLTFFVVPAPKTLFKNIYKLPPGHFGTINKRGDVKIKEYWDAIYKTDYKKTEEEWQKEIIADLKESIKLRMMSDVPFGAYLSGGVDSSANTILMNDLMDRPIDTFTVSFKNDPEFDESKYAKQISRQFKTNYHEIKIDKNDLINYFDKLIYTQDEPIADWVCFPLYFVSKLIRDNGVIVAQVGEGSDELFCGYDGYMQYINLHKKYQKLTKLPKFIKTILYFGSKIVYKFYPARFLPELFRKVYYNEEYFWGGAIAFSEFEKQHLLTNNFKSKHHYNSYKIVKKLYKKIDKATPNRDFLDRMTYLELKNRLAELLLMRVDKIGSSVSLEARVPFLDHKFVEKMLTIPQNLKIKEGPKTILKKALKGIVPKNIIYRPKKGFGAPISKWLKSPRFAKFLMNKIYDSKLLKTNYLNINYIKTMFDQHKQGQADFSVQLWILANVCAWYDLWIKDEKKS